MVFFRSELGDVEDVGATFSFAGFGDIDFRLHFFDRDGREHDVDVVGGGIVSAVPERAPERADVCLCPGGIGHDNVNGAAYTRIQHGEESPIVQLCEASPSCSLTSIHSLATWS